VRGAVGAELIVSVDDRHMPRLADAFGIDCWTPEQFYGDQTDLELDALTVEEDEAQAPRDE
jgi:hypothetical protein